MIQLEGLQDRRLQQAWNLAQVLLSALAEARVPRCLHHSPGRCSQLVAETRKLHRLCGQEGPSSQEVLLASVLFQLHLELGQLLLQV